MTTRTQAGYHIPVKKDQLITIVPKVWGHEEWIVNNDFYCGKKLFFKARGYACSLHFHKIKDETFYITSGAVLIELENEKKRWTRTMTPGDIQHIPIGLKHRIIALEPSEVIEFSTHHRDDDSYRITQAGFVDIASFNQCETP